MISFLLMLWHLKITIHLIINLVTHSLFMLDGNLIKSIIKKETAQKDGQGSAMTYEVTTVELPLIIGL